MVCTSFQVKAKLRRVCFFQETFLVADTSTEVILGMLSLFLNNGDVMFAKIELTWRTYSVGEILQNTK